MKIKLTNREIFHAASWLRPKALNASAILMTTLLTACGGDSSSGQPAVSTPASLPIPERVQAKINNDASNVAATISINGGAPQEMTISNGSATFQVTNLEAREHEIVITFWQILGGTRIELAQSTSTITVVAGQNVNLAPDVLAYNTAFDHDGDDIPNVDDDDNDNDGISDENELAYGWDPLDEDSDNDGIKDGDEVPALAIATPIPAGVAAKIATTGVVVNAGIVVDNGTEREMGIANGRATFNVLALLPGDHVVVITFYQRFGAARIELARHTANVTVVAGQAATLGDSVLTYDTAFDVDNDGTRNIADSDNDNDSVADVDDQFPLNANESVDSDGDGIGNNADTDDDNDGVADTSDAFPLDPTESVDTDGDGIGNNADPDDDNDGIPDVDEAGYGKNPLVADSDEVAVKISGGGDHTCVVVFNGEVRCWGFNEYGALGNGDSGDNRISFSPVAVSDMDDATEVRTSIGHSCVLRDGGNVSCWGNNTFSEISDDDDDDIDSTVPVDVGSLVNATDVQLTLGVSCGIVGGNVACVGDVSGLASNPVARFIGDPASSIGAGAYHSCIVASDATVSCYGAYLSGQLGNGNILLPPLAPVTVQNINTAVAVAVGANHSCAQLQSGTIQCWGANDEAQLGDGTTATRLTPVNVGTVVAATALAVGADHNCALEAGMVRCWGSNASGQLGNGSSDPFSANPVLVSGITNAIAISAGEGHSCAVLANGRAMCWGSNAYGQLGSGTAPGDLTSSNVPVFVNGF